MKRLLTTIITALAILTAIAAPQQREEKRLVSEGVPFFVPHWYVSAHVGAQYNVGEAKLKDLISPALQLSLGYQYNPLFATRLSISGWEARNQYAYPQVKYTWNYVQPAFDALLNVTNLIGGWQETRQWSAYAFAGLGVALSFNNDDAEEASQTRYGVLFEKLWTGSRWNPVVRAGIGADYRVSENIAIGAEINANMLPDHFNSKLGRKDNRDWAINAMLGLKFFIGKTHGRTEPVYETVVPTPPPAPIVVRDTIIKKVVVRDTVVQKIKDVPIDQISFNVNIYFTINRSNIRQTEVPKLRRLLKYLNEHPNAFIRLSGYADKETGTAAINMRLSRERCQAVSEWLQNEFISEDRIRRFAKGDKVQPFEIPEDNRVCVCYVYDPDNPVPQKFEY